MTTESPLIALDIGGANMKASDGEQWSATITFPLWKEWKSLPAMLESLVKQRRPQRLVATMTGEICDCYPSRAAGVAHIVESLVAASRAIGCEKGPGVYLLDGRVVPALEAVQEWPLASASNWHAVARLAAHIVQDARAFLIDIGSTTTDIIPLDSGSPAPLTFDDPGRMLSGELVYTGLERTAVAAIVRRLPHRGTWRPVASELFAESRDAWLILNALPEETAATNTADGGPETRYAARVRLARTMLLDPDAFSDDDATQASEWIANRQASQIARAARRVSKEIGWAPEAIVVSGHGEPLLTRGLALLGWNVTTMPIADSIGPAGARVAPAYALARIATGVIP